MGADIFGLRQKQHKDWFDENDLNINQLLSKKRKLFNLLLKENLSNRLSVEKAYKEHKAVVRRANKSWEE